LFARPTLAAIAGGVALAFAAAQATGSLGAPWAAASAAPLATSAALWFDGRTPRPAARAALGLLGRAREEGLDPAAYDIPAIEAALTRDPETASALLSKALADYARDLRVPRSLSDVTYIDPELVPAPPRMADPVVGGSAEAALTALESANPLYAELRAGLADYRRTWGALPQDRVPEGPAIGPGSRGERVAALRRRLGLPAGDRHDARLGEAISAFRVAHGLAARPIVDGEAIAALNRGAPAYEARILADLDRLRGLPADGRRHIVVDTAAAQLRLIADGRQVDVMRVVVGKPGMATPLLAGFIRYAIVNPYWCIPPDLVRHTVAPAVLREGTGVLARRRYVLSADWRSTERLDPAAVDWRAVAEGRASVWVRQLPGGRNMMGAVKFMLPNDMGIYLHDTPDKSLFQRENRRLSSGCVRVEDAARLGRWLFGREIVGSDPSPDKRIDLAEPVPVFITRLSTRVENGQIRFRPGTDAPQG